MDIVTDPTFWGEISLTVASRLALLAAVLWVARLAVRNAVPKTVPRADPLTATPRRVKRENRRVDHPEPHARFIDLRNRRDSVLPEAEPKSETEPRDNPLRNRLQEYLEQRTTEGVRP